MIRQKIVHFKTNEAGSIAILGAITIVVMIMAAGLALDTYNAQSQDTALQHIVDLTCDRVAGSDMALYPSTENVNSMAISFSNNLKLGTASKNAVIAVSTSINVANPGSFDTTIEASDVFNPTLTAVMGFKPAALKKTTSCQRSLYPQTCKTAACSLQKPTSNIILSILDASLVQTTKVNSLAGYSVTDKVGDGSNTYVYTIIDNSNGNKIIDRKTFSNDLSLDPTSLPNGGKGQVIYIQALNKDGTIPTLYMDSLIKTGTFPSSPNAISPPSSAPDSNPPPANPPSSIPSTLILPCSKPDHSNSQSTRPYSITPTRANFVTGTTSELLVTGYSTAGLINYNLGLATGSSIPGGHSNTGTIPITSNFQPLTLDNYDPEANFFTEIVDPELGHNRSQYRLLDSGYKVDYVIDDFNAMLQTADGTCIRTSDPIIIDLPNKGYIQTTGTSTAKTALRTQLGNTVFFDLLGTGTSQNTEWLVGNGQGLLVDNRDGNAAKDMNGKRLFGNDAIHAHGYEKLASLFKTDANGVISGDNLKGLAVWVDDGNAKVDEGEIKTLSELGITAISTRMSEVKDFKGDRLMRSYVMRNNIKIMSEDVWFGMVK